MKNLIKNIKNWLNPKPCQHNQNYDLTQSLLQNTPYVSFRCLDCDYTDNGIVHGNPDEWKTFTKVVRNGVVVEEFNL